MNRKERSDTEIRFKGVKDLAIIDAISDGWRNLLKYGVIAVFFICVYKSIESLSGKYTFADIVIRLFTEVHSRERAIQFSVSFMSVWYGISQNQLRRRTVKRLTTRLDRYEKMLDPDKSSSNLDEYGARRK